MTTATMTIRSGLTVSLIVSGCASARGGFPINLLLSVVSSGAGGLIVVVLRFDA